MESTMEATGEKSSDRYCHPQENNNDIDNTEATVEDHTTTPTTTTTSHCLLSQFLCPEELDSYSHDTIESKMLEWIFSSSQVQDLPRLFPTKMSSYELSQAQAQKQKQKQKDGNEEEETYGTPSKNIRKSTVQKYWKQRKLMQEISLQPGVYLDDDFRFVIPNNSIVAAEDDDVDIEEEEDNHDILLAVDKLKKDIEELSKMDDLFQNNTNDDMMIREESDSQQQQETNNSAALIEDTNDDDDGDGELIGIDEIEDEEEAEDRYQIMKRERLEDEASKVISRVVHIYRNTPGISEDDFEFVHVPRPPDQNDIANLTIRRILFSLFAAISALFFIILQAFPFSPESNLFMDLYSLSSSFTPTFVSSSSSSSSPHIVITGNEELAQHGDMIELRDLRQHAIYCGSSLDRSAIIQNNEDGDIFNCADEVLHIPSTTILNLESSTSPLDPIHFAKNGLNVTWNLTCIDEEEESNSNDERCEVIPQSDTKQDSTSCKVRDKKKKKNKKQSPSPCFRSIHDGAISLNDIDSALSMSAELIENYRGTHSKIYYNTSLLDTYIPTLLSKLQHLLDEQIIATTTSQKKKSLVTTPVAFRMSMSLPNKQPKPKKQKWSFSFFSFKSFPFYKFWKNTNNDADNNDKGGGESKNDNISIRDRLRRTMNETAPYKWIVKKIDETSSIFFSSVESIPYNGGSNETDSTIVNNDVITKDSDSSLNIAYHFIHEKVNYMIELTGFYLSFLFQISPLVSSLSYYYDDQTEHPPPPNARGGDSHSAATTSTSSTSSCEYIMNDMAFSKDFEYLTSVFISGEKDFSGGNMVFADYDATTEEEGDKSGSTNDSSENINNNDNRLERGLVVDGSLGRTVISSGGLENKRCVLPIGEGIRVVLQVWWKQN